MAKTYFAKIRVAGISTPQLAQVQSNNTRDAKKLITVQNGGNVRFLLGPVPQPPNGKPPSWYR